MKWVSSYVEGIVGRGFDPHRLVRRCMSFKKLIAHPSLPAPSRRRCCHRARRGQTQPADGRDGRLGLSCDGCAQPKVERVDARPTSTQRRCRAEETIWGRPTCSEILGIYLYLLVPDPWHLSRRDKTCPVSKSRHLSRQDKINGSVSQKNAPRAVRAMVKKKNGSRI